MKFSRLIFAFLVVVSPGIFGSGIGSIEHNATRQIDSSYEKIWSVKGIRPAELSSDQEFVRRVYLDITGRIPKTEEALVFINSNDPEKRQKLIAQLVGTLEFAEYFSSIWTASFLGYKNSFYLDRSAFQDWLKSEIQQDHGWDRIANQLITAKGSMTKTPAVSWYIKQRLNAANLADDTSRLFLGVQLGCARCHNHPHEQWKLEDFYGLAAFFSGLKKEELPQEEKIRLLEIKRTARRILEKYKTPELARQKAADRFKELREMQQDLYRVDDKSSDTITAEIQGREQVYPAKFLLDPKPAHVTENQRAALAAWITSGQNPFFSKAFVNRTWGMMMGRGFVQPVDDMGGSNSPSNPELLTSLADDFRLHGYSIKYLVTTIANSRVYQLSSEAKSDGINYERAKIQMMNPDQLFQSFLIATDIEESLRRTSLREFEDRKQMIYQYHVSLFENDDSGQNANSESTIPQALFLLNGKFTNEATSPQFHNTLSKIMEDKKPEERIDKLFLAAFSRHATPEEIKSFRPSVDKIFDYEDVFCALLNSNEFLFNH